MSEFEMMHAQPGGAYAEAMRQRDEARAEIEQLTKERDGFREALGQLASLCPPHIMERYREQRRANRKTGLES